MRLSFHLLFIFWACSEPAGPHEEGIKEQNPQACNSIVQQGLGCSGTMKDTGLPAFTESTATVQETCPCKCAELGNTFFDIKCFDDIHLRILTLCMKVKKSERISMFAMSIKTMFG